SSQRCQYWAGSRRRWPTRPRAPGGGVDPRVPTQDAQHPDYVHKRGLIEDFDHFDPAAFGLSAREAELFDPQIRQLLEVAAETLDDAGCDPDRFNGAIGVWCGVRSTDHLLRLFAERPDVVEKVGAFNATMANDKDYAASRVAFALGLRGPAVSVHTACSTSLVAAHEAARALAAGECDLALAGGAALTLPQRSGHLYDPGGMRSKDGRCRPFDAEATGTVFSDGVAMVALRRLDDALRMGDPIHAVWLGSALNNDGRHKASFTAPNPDAQAQVILQALRSANVSPKTIGFVEAHGTATPIGDPIEVEALLRAYGRSATPTAVLGSVKSNLGHLTAAAGAAGLIKACLAVRSGQIPGTLHFQTPNPLLDLGGRFCVSAEVETFSTAPRRAAVTSLGVGGTNAHAIVQEPPARPLNVALRPDFHLLCLSARTPKLLDETQEDLRGFVEASPALDLAGLELTLLSGRRRRKHRRVLVARSRAHLLETLAETRGTTIDGVAGDEARPAVWLFPGQGSHYARMGLGLAACSPEFCYHLDACGAALVDAWRGLTLKEVLSDADRLMHTRYAQPALFAVSLAWARTLLDFGLTPAAMVGHSVGEFVAATLAGVFDASEAIRLVAARGEAMEQLPSGAMLAVRAPVSNLELPDTLDLAAENGPRMSVVAGPIDAISAYEVALEARGVPSKRVRTKHAFHSRMVSSDLVEGFRARVASVGPASPTHRIVSTATGEVLTDEQARDPGYWARHMRVSVRFAPAIRTVADAVPQPALWMECGPGRGVLASMVGATLRPTGRRDDVLGTGLSSDPDASSPQHEQEEALSFGRCLGQAWAAGAELSLERRVDSAQRISAPASRFERRRYWLLPDKPPVQASAQPAEALVGPTPSASNAAPTLPVGSANAAVDPGADLLEKLRRVMVDLLGEPIELEDVGRPFLDLGFDSLMLTQLSGGIRRSLGVDVSFIALSEQLTTPALVAEHLRAQTTDSSPVAAESGTDVLPPRRSPRSSASERLQAPSRPHGPQLVLQTSRSSGPTLTQRQARGLAHLTERYCERTKSSKAFAARNRSQLADPRTVSGFSPQLKELVYPLTMSRSSGCHLTDLDGNDYVDLLSGYGSNFLGFGAPFVREAIVRQMEMGMEIGPQTPLVEEAAALFRELVPTAERVAFCNTGSEAVLACLRLARTVTARDVVVAFTGGYHGIFDEVVARPTKRGSRPAAAGIPSASVENIVLLPWDDPK
ncbi:MAG: aminotransferase class III-fold pyridoxal phosphate-dependent enzyme, partial [Myxococcota bacterium]